MNEKEIVGDELRRQAGYKQVSVSELARKLGRNRNVLINYLDGSRPLPTSLFLEICKTLGVDAGQVIDIIAKRIENEAGGTSDSLRVANDTDDR